jgi:hypothetical protein
MPEGADVKKVMERIDLEEVKGKLGKYHSEIKKFLESFEASMETSKFSVERDGDGLSIEIAIKARIRPKKKHGAK